MHLAKHTKKNTLSECINAITTFIQIRTKKLNKSINTHAKSFLKDPNVTM